MNKLRVGIAMGGRSIEREVSFNSGRTVCDHLDPHHYEVIPLYQTMEGLLYILPWHFLHRGKTTDFEKRLRKEAEQITWDALKQRIDFIYIAMHGRYAEDGILQGTLELLCIPYLGSSRLTSALCMDKYRVKKLLSYYGISTPQGIIINPHELETITQQEIVQRLENASLQGPWVIKPNQEGSSLGISVVRETKYLLPALQKACSIHPTKRQPVLIEEYLSGMEFSCILLYDYKNNRPLPLLPTEIVREAGTDIFDYDQKYMPGRATKFTPPRCTKEIIANIQQTCTTVMESLAIKTIARIDGFVTSDGRVIIVDPNTSSGMAPSSFLFREAAAMTNMNHAELINHLIETDLVRYDMMKQIQRTKQHLDSSTKLRVAVLLGGPSQEREISLESGRNVIYKLSPYTYEVTPLFVDEHHNLHRITTPQLVLNSTREITENLTPDQCIEWHSLKGQFDFVFIALHGGIGENGSVQGMLEMLDLPYNGSSVLSSALCMDKYKTGQYLRATGFDTPQQLLIEKKEWHILQDEFIETITHTIKAPYIAKPHDDGCSILVHKVHKKKELKKIINTIFEHGKESVLIEECITGMELTVGVMGNTIAQALPPSQAIASGSILSIEEKFLPGAGENQTPAPLSASAHQLVKHTMEQAYKQLGCKGYARIDCFYQTAQESPTHQDRVIILEVNTLPGLTPATCIFHQAAEIGMKPMEFIDRIIQYGLEEHSVQHHNPDMLPMLPTIPTNATPLL